MEQLRVGDLKVLQELEQGGERATRVGAVRDLLFAWVLPLIWRGNSRPLEEREVPVNGPDDRTQRLAEKAEALWAAQVKRRGEDKASLLPLLGQMQWFELTLGVVLSVAQGVLFSVGRPLLLGKIIDIVSEEGSTNAEGFTWAAVFAAVVLAEGVLQAQVKQLLSCRLGARYMAWMSSLVQKKATTVSSVAVSKAGLQEAALIGGDVTRMVEEWRWLSLFPYVMTSLIGGVVVLALTLGLASIVGFVIMFGIAFINWRITKVIKRIEEKDFALGDKRIGILREILAGIKAIKMMAWEIPFQKLITAAREEETHYIRLFRSFQVSSVNFGRASPVLAASFSVLTLALTDVASLRAATIFVAISSYQGLRLPLISIPLQSAMFANTLVSFGRLRRYLLLEDAPPAEPLAADSALVVQVDNADFRWSAVPAAAAAAAELAKKEDAAATEAGEEDDDAASGSLGDAPAAFTLRGIDLAVRRNNHLVAVVGRVGSGKSSLLSSVLGSMFVEDGHVRLCDNVAYIPQKAFVMSGTVIENILMGKPFDEALLRAVMRASALDVDLKSLANGLETEIGERGQTLSGGQAARVSIARALYHQPDLLLLDDPLSAVDPEVANNLFRRSVLGFLGRFGDLYASSDSAATKPASDDSAGGAGPAAAAAAVLPKRSVLMSLNQLHLLPHFDHVVVLDGGTIAEQGSYDDLAAKEGGALAEMLRGLEGMDGGDLSEHLERDQAEAQDEADAEAQALAAAAAAKVAAAEPSAPQEQAPAAAAAAAAAADASPAEKPGKPPGPEKAAHHTLVSKEGGAKGAVSGSVMGMYFRSMGWHRLPMAIVFGMCTYAFMAAGDLFLANWIRQAETIESSQEHLRNAGIYIGLMLCNVVGIETLSLHNTRSSVKASKSVHQACIDRIMHAPIQWFEETPSGRVISRFSGDLSMVDRQLAFMFDDTFQFGFLLLSLSVVVCYIVPVLAVVVVLGLTLFLWQIVVVDRTNREVKRYTNQALSPILTNTSETVGARDLIRCMRLESFFRGRHYQHTDRYTANMYLSHTLVNFSTLMAGLVSFLLSSGAAFTVIAQRESYDPALVGLALTYSFLVPYFLSILSVVLPIGFTALTSLERIVEYNSDAVPQEPAWYCEGDDQLREGVAGPSEIAIESGDGQETNAVSFVLPDGSQATDRNDAPRTCWPSKGTVEFQDVTLIYREGLAPALRNVTVTFQGGDKVGVCGRTGAGKSSLTLLLFRVHEAATGRILIDGQDISQIGLQLLRSSLTIIPQSPLLLEGSLRDNLDPFDQYSDEELLGAMRKVGLDTGLLRPKEEEGEDGLSLSIGEKQLLSLARAILRSPASLRIVVLDEPTSSLDMGTDDLVQKVVRTAFADSTTITIAHRLGSIIDSDKILVMDSGRVAEYGAPEELLNRKEGHLRAMVAAMGGATSEMLEARARDAAQARATAAAAK